MDWLIEQAELMRDVHVAELARLQKELRIKDAEIASQRLVLQASHLALRGCRGLPMPPHARDRVRGALVATGRALGIKTVD
jgi:hypothetical protein